MLTVGHKAYITQKYFNNLSMAHLIMNVSLIINPYCCLVGHVDPSKQGRMQLAHGPCLLLDADFE
jgi:hypothetical protein